MGMNVSTESSASSIGVCHITRQRGVRRVESALDDNYLSLRGLDGPGQYMFVQRWTELLNPRTIASYRVRILNAHQALLELREAIESILVGTEKSSHFDAVRDECLVLLKQDLVLTAHMSPLVKQLLDNVGSANSTKRTALTRLANQLEHSLALVSPQYLPRLVELMEARIKANDLCQVDSLASSLATELISRGWAQRKLYAAKWFFTSGQGFLNGWTRFREMVLGDRRAFTSIIPLSKASRDAILPIRDSIAKHDVELWSRTELGRGDFQTLTGSQQMIPSADLYAVLRCEEYDEYSAATTSIARLDGVRETLHFFGIEVESPGQCLVIDDRSRIAARVKPQEPWLPLNPSFQSAVFGKVADILSGTTHAEETRLRLINALSAYAMADESPTAISQFMNLWIALESFCRYDGCEGTVAGLLLVLPPLISRRYLYRVSRNYMEDCGRTSRSILGDLFDADVPSGWSTRVGRLVQIVQEAKGRSLLMSRTAGHTLLEYRAQEVMSRLSDPKQAAEAISSHTQRLMWHLRRLYRVRNCIVHSGTATMSIDPLVKHLRDYVTMAITDCVHLLWHSGLTNLDSLFERCIDSHAAALKHFRSGGAVSPEIVTRDVF